MARRKEPEPKKVVITRYVNDRGERVPKGAPGARRVTDISDTYYGQVGGKRVSLETTDLGQAWATLRKKLREARERELGISTDRDDRAAAPLAEHLDAWLKAVADDGTSADQVKLLRSRVGRVVALAGWRRAGDVSADRCRDALARLQREEGAPSVAQRYAGEGRSARTRNHYLRGLKQFSAWLVREHLLPSDPLRGLRPQPVETDRRHERRAPTDDEVAQLFDYLAWRNTPMPPPPERNGMSGRQRALAYELCMATGLRAGELRKLGVGSFDLDADPPTVTLPAAYDKRRRLAVQPLPDWLVAELRAWFAEGNGCWERFPSNWPGRILTADLEACGVPYAVPDRDGAPLFFDFHALRHYYATQLANQPGISPKTLMDLCRHSTPALTLKTYAKARAEGVRDAVAGLRRPGGGGPKTG